MLDRDKLKPGNYLRMRKEYKYIGFLKKYRFYKYLSFIKKYISTFICKVKPTRRYL